MSRLGDWAARRELEAERRSTQTPKFGRKARRDKITGKTCRYPGCYNSNVEYHHIIPRSKIKDERLARPENAMPLCHTHHQQHHTTIHRVPFSALLPDEVAFVILHAGREWLKKWYPTKKEGV